MPAPPVATPAVSSVNFLSDIRNLQFKLKKTETPDAEAASKKKMVDSEEVAAILMRRVALEMSDSEDGDEDDDDAEWE
nr:hypothetical protein HK105_007525 [Polyrhizophydium stewartii]